MTTPVVIERLSLSARAYNLLVRSGIDTLESLCSLSREELLNTRGFGKAVVQEIEAALRVRNLSLTHR